MSPEIEDGDEVICDPDVDVQNGDMVHYTIGNEEAIKIYVRDEDAFILQFVPYNQSGTFKTRTIRLDDEEANEVKISKVVSVNKLKFNNRAARLKMIGRA
jgi:SOS-response transcriptional repressor LexA